jgi:phosphoserine phosphatase
MLLVICTFDSFRRTIMTKTNWKREAAEVTTGRKVQAWCERQARGYATPFARMS